VTNQQATSRGFIHDVHNGRLLCFAEARVWIWWQLIMADVLEASCFYSGNPLLIV